MEPDYIIKKKSTYDCIWVMRIDLAIFGVVYCLNANQM